MRAAIGPQHAEFQLENAAVGERLSRQVFSTVAVFGVHAGQPFFAVHRPRLRRQAAQAPHLFVPMQVVGGQVQLPGSKPGSAGRQGDAVLRALQRHLGAAAFGDVERDPQKSLGLAGGVAQHHAANHVLVPAAVAMAIARLHIHRLRAAQRFFSARIDARAVVRVHQVAQFLQVHAIGAWGQTQGMPALRVGLDAATGQIVSPDGDAAQVHGQRQLGLQLARGDGQGAGLKWLQWLQRQQSQRPAAAWKWLAVGLELAAVGALKFGGRGWRNSHGTERGRHRRAGPKCLKEFVLHVTQRLQGGGVGPLHAAGRVKLQDRTGECLQQPAGVGRRRHRGSAG